MSARVRTLLAQGGSFVLAGVLLYLALRGVDFDAVVLALREADYRWLVPLIAVALLSHLLRAWRWLLLLAALPADTAADADPKNVSLKTAFYALMIGYMVNYAAPRLGEVARSANVASRERLPFSSVFGTVIVERVLDMVVLLLGLASVGLLLLDQAADLEALFIAPLVDSLGRLPLALLMALIPAVLLLVFLLYRRALRNAALQQLWAQRVRPVLTSFKDGLYTLLRMRRPWALLLSTAAMWFGYLLLAYLPFEMLGMAERYGLSLLDAWSIMILGAVGMAIPSPGGTGSYHYITKVTLVSLFGVGEAAAVTYAVLSHGAQLVLYVIVGTLCLLLQGAGFRAIRKAARRPEAPDGAAGESVPLEASPRQPSS